MASKRGTSATRVADHRNMRASQRSIAKQLLAGTAMSLGAMMLFAPVDAQAAQAAAAANRAAEQKAAAQRDMQATIAQAERAEAKIKRFSCIFGLQYLVNQLATIKYWQGISRSILAIF